MAFPSNVVRIWRRNLQILRACIYI